MAMATQERGMARKAGRPKGARNDASVKIDAELVDLARVVGAHRKTSLNELLSDLLRDPVKRAHAQMVKELTRSAKGNDES
jgi:uncharacterized protein (DUF4415 family)